MIASTDCEYCEICKWQDRQWWTGDWAADDASFALRQPERGSIKIVYLSKFQKTKNTDNAYTHDRGKSDPLWSSCMEKFDAGAAE